MESVGQILREERLRQSLTLQEVSANTRISLKNLEAIERDDLEEISSPFFYRSFVRQYAERLGIDFSNLSVAVNSSASTMPRPLMPGENGAPLPRVARAATAAEIRLTMDFLDSVACRGPRRLLRRLCFVACLDVAIGPGIDPAIFEPVPTGFAAILAAATAVCASLSSLQPAVIGRTGPE